MMFTYIKNNEGFTKIPEIEVGMKVKLTRLDLEGRTYNYPNSFKVGGTLVVKEINNSAFYYVCSPIGMNYATFCFDGSMLAPMSAIRYKKEK